jgi:hypothetical protein
MYEVNNWFTHWDWSPRIWIQWLTCMGETQKLEIRVCVFMTSSVIVGCWHHHFTMIVITSNIAIPLFHHPTPNVPSFELYLPSPHALISPHTLVLLHAKDLSHIIHTNSKQTKVLLHITTFLHLFMFIIQAPSTITWHTRSIVYTNFVIHTKSTHLKVLWQLNMPLFLAPSQVPFVIDSLGNLAKDFLDIGHSLKWTLYWHETLLVHHKHLGANFCAFQIFVSWNMFIVITKHLGGNLFPC